ncbi:UPF0481 protein At3g47200-like [Macadamia integrifolia]|uniref:UPF0481 protein At3g47200-like n=1 Tax=Macadamia integrifolia TaxID=60698 RepID=UPI001C4E8EFD|nr:UPF0481 protein At3g47200-like [Macadamia integrifolia]
MSILEDSGQQGLETSEVVEARPRIQQVSTLLREVEKNRNCYDPRLVSFGPYHYGNPKLQLGQTLKTKLVRRRLSSFKDQTSSGKSIKDIFNEDFDKVAYEARDCYAMGSTDKFNHQEFKCLMFLDGCFIVYFIHFIVNGKQDHLKMKNDHIAFTIMDFLLLENQLPYIVLQTLLTTLIPEENIDLFEKFIDLQTKATGSISTREPLYHSLLGLFICCSNSLRKKSISYDETPTTTVKNEPIHLLDIFRNKFLSTSSSLPINGKSQEVQSDEDEDNWQSFRSVQELKVAGIRCICAGTCYPKKVKFWQHNMYGELSLPAIVVDDSTKTKWLNLVAYEACPDFSNDLAFTSFVCFVDSLIDHAEDVKKLRLQGVLLNGLGSDQNVADLFNDMTIDLTPNPTAYMKVKCGIQRHYKNRWGIWIAEALQTNFRTPWTTTAFFAALFIIILTLFQLFSPSFRPTSKKLILATMIKLPRSSPKLSISSPQEGCQGHHENASLV